MSWTFAEIESDWRPGALAAPPPEIAAAFNRVDKIFGRAWIEESRISSGSVVRGSAPTLHIVSMGQKLTAIEDLLDKAEKLIERIRRRDNSAHAELTAIYLLRSRRPTAEVDLDPPVGDRISDFRIRRGGDEPWTYVEVTLPDVSDAQNRAMTVIERLTALLKPIKRPFALDVFLRREPTAAETDSLAERVPQFCNLDGVHRSELANELGFLLLNASPPGQVVFHNHVGEENRPRIGMSKGIVGPGEPHRHIAVRMAFADERAETFLRREARQLPEDAPGLVMVQMSRVPGGFKTWEPLLLRRFQPTIHTRVGAVCLYSGALLTTSRGEAWLPETKMIANPHGKFPLPSWMSDALREAGAEFEQCVRP